MYSVSEASGSFVPVLAKSRRWRRAPFSASPFQRSDFRSFRHSRVGPLPDRDPERVLRLVRNLVVDRYVPAADEQRRNRGHVGVEPGFDPALDSGHVSLRRRHRLIAREQQRDVDRDSGEDRLLDRRQPLRSAGDLDEDVPRSAAVQVRRLLLRRLGVVGEQRRHLQRDPAVHPVGSVVLGLEQLRGAPDVGQGELEEDLLRVGPGLAELGDLLVVCIAAADRLVEDRRVRRLPRDGELVDVPLKSPVVEHRPGDRVEPEALTKVVELLRGLHLPVPPWPPRPPCLE